MADFNQAYSILKSFENRQTPNGLIIYSDDIDDLGGETVFGIARNKWPKLPLWKEVDKLKETLSVKPHEKGFALEISLAIQSDIMVEQYVKNFYIQNYWNKFAGDEIENQAFATGVLLITVNAGLLNGMKVSQRAVGTKDDGIFGKNTKAKFVSANYKDVINLVTQQELYYERIIQRRPKNAKYRNGWMRRARYILKMI